MGMVLGDCKEYICVEVATIPSIVGAYDMLLR